MFESMIKKLSKRLISFVVSAFLCCMVALVSNANWLSILFSRFVFAADEDGYCFDLRMRCRSGDRAACNEYAANCGHIGL